MQHPFQQHVETASMQIDNFNPPRPLLMNRDPEPITQHSLINLPAVISTLRHTRWGPSKHFGELGSRAMITWRYSLGQYPVDCRIVKCRTALVRIYKGNSINKYERDMYHP